MLELIDLTALADMSAQKLSGGEQKRLALGRVLIAEPKLLLLDEPAAHLDNPSRRVVERLLTNTNISLLLVTHDLHLAHRIAHRVLNMQAGRISPNLPENILEGCVDRDTLVTANGLRIHLPPDTSTMTEGASDGSTPPTDGDTLTVMLNPRNLILSHKSIATTPYQITGRVCSIHEQDGNIWLGIDCGDHLTVITDERTYNELEINLNRELAVSYLTSIVKIQ